MTKQVFTIDTKPGIQRDGTIFDMDFYTDGRWVRFQRGRPRKINGYRSITNYMHGYSRGVYVNSVDGNNQIFNGYNAGLEVVNVNNEGVGSGISPIAIGGPILTTGTLVGGTLYTNNTYTGVSLTGGTGSGAKATIIVAGNTVTSVTITTKGISYLSGDTLSALAADIGGTGSGFSIKVVTVDSQFVASDLTLWQFDSGFDAAGTNRQLLYAHPGQNLAQIDNTVPTAVLAGDIAGGVMTPLQDINGVAPTGATISVAGGVVVLHPYVFVYGDNGLIKNCSAGNPFDWNSPDSNETNVSSTKVVKGLPVRGGSNAPSGLFWSLDSLIRVSYTPTTISTGSTSSTFYWRYDIVTSQSSILSSQSVIEYDGVYYWIGVDRFLLYNGVVKELTNNFNQNYFFDNLNYAQRQKVYATKVPRFGEIWWFYPSGNSEECNDCIIYNIRENCWYDAGQADGARRTAGYFSQVFKYPVNMGSTLSTQEIIFSDVISTTNTLATIEVPVNNQIATGQVVVATGIPVGAYITLIAPSISPGYLTVTLSAAATATDLVTATFETPAGRVTLWQHEIGTDRINNAQFFAIESSFETNDLGWVSGGPSQAAPMGENHWLHIERIEPDFIQEGTMSVQVTGRPYSQAEDVTSSPYYFEPGTHKIDMREQRRELRLRFTSNVAGGNYQLGKVLLNANMGDVRGY